MMSLISILFISASSWGSPLTEALIFEKGHLLQELGRLEKELAGFDSDQRALMEKHLGLLSKAEWTLRKKKEQMAGLEQKLRAQRKEQQMASRLSSVTEQIRSELKADTITESDLYQHWKQKRHTKSTLQVVGTNGEMSLTEILRFGDFLAVDKDGQFFKPDKISGELVFSAIAGGYYFDSSDQPESIRQDRTWGEFFEQAGPIGVLILALGMMVSVLLVIRTYFLYRAHAHVRAQTQKELDDDPKERLGFEAQMSRFQVLIPVVAAVAPLLGLLGTVTGMIETFQVMTVFGSGKPELLSGGISEALITTQLGLIVAIPALFFGQLLSGWAQSIKKKVESPS